MCDSTPLASCLPSDKDADAVLPSGVGENGTLEYTAEEVGDHLVAFFFALVRNLPDERMYDLFQLCLDEVRKLHDQERGMEDLFVLAFQTRDCRGGKGERALFLKMMVLLYAHKPRAVLRVLPLIAEYGYFKDYVLLLERPYLPAELKDAIIQVLVKQTRQDIEAFENKHADNASHPQHRSISLCAKYLPREGGSFEKHHKAVFEELVQAIYPLASLAAAKVQYRKAVSLLTKELAVPEVKMAGKRFADINFEQTPSVCLKKHRKAFLNELVKQKPQGEEEATGNRYPTDADRVACRQHLMHTITAKPDKVKAAQVFPHEIVQHFMNDACPGKAEAELFETQWRNLREHVLKTLAATDSASAGRVDLGRLVPLVDVSRSMQGQPMLVAITLGILVSEINHPAFRDRFLTFEDTPQWVNLSNCSRLQEKVHQTQRAPWGGSTDFERAFDLIAKAIETHNLGPEDIPDMIVFSDMQFNCAIGDGDSQTQLQRIQTRFHALGMRMRGKPFPAPRIIFWNLRGDTAGFPAQASSANVQMLSGFSPSLLKGVLDGDMATPASTVQKMLSDKRYHAVRIAYRSEREVEAEAEA